MHSLWGGLGAPGSLLVSRARLRAGLFQSVT